MLKGLSLTVEEVQQDMGRMLLESRQKANAQMMHSFAAAIKAANTGASEGAAGPEGSDAEPNREGVTHEQHASGAAASSYMRGVTNCFSQRQFASTGGAPSAPLNPPNDGCIYGTCKHSTNAATNG